MSAFDRLWAMQVHVPKERFITAFRLVMAVPYREYYGNINEHEFVIKKEVRARYQIGFCELYGRLSEGADGLLLDLEMRNNLKWNYIELSIYPLLISFAISLRISPGYFFPVLVVVIFLIEVRLVHVYQNYAKREYTKLINDIANLRISGGKAV